MQLAGRMNAALSPTCTPQCPQIAIFRNTTAANAMLVVTADQAKFVYAPQFFPAVYDKYGDGAIIAMIAHEYGHALDEVHPASWMKSEGTPELRADAWAGCALAKSDLSSNDLAEALTAVSKYPPPTGFELVAPSAGSAARVYPLWWRRLKIRQRGRRQQAKLVG